MTVEIIGVNVPISMGLSKNCMVALKAYKRLKEAGYENIKVMVIDGRWAAMGQLKGLKHENHKS